MVKVYRRRLNNKLKEDKSHVNQQNRFKVLVVGQGAREHALCWKIKKSALTQEVFCWPSNPAIATEVKSFDFPADGQLDDLVHGIKASNFDLVVVGPEQPLDNGLANKLKAVGIPAFGPVSEGARLESSKAFAKEVMDAAGIPTADYKAVNIENLKDEAIAFFEKNGSVVLKASGLASGKGVFVCSERSQVDAALERMTTTMQTAAETTVLEELLVGRECSYFTFLGQGKSSPLGFAVDFKRLQDGDIGPNTGGMGCYTPVPWLPEDAKAIVEEKIVTPLLEELSKRGIDYIGCLYVGIMWGDQGPKVIEFNVRLGDPEAQVLAMSDSRDWLDLILHKALPGFQSTVETEDSKTFSPAICQVLASNSYPYGEGDDDHAKLDVEVFSDKEVSKLFGAAVKYDSDGNVVAGSGRVLSVISRSDSFINAKAKNQELIDSLKQSWSGFQYRRDIATKLINEITKTNY